MKEIFIKVKSLLTLRERRQARLLFIAIMLMGLMEVIGITSVLPFISVVADPEVIQKNRFLGAAFQMSGASSVNHFIVVLGVFSLIALALNNSFSAMTTWFLYRFTYMCGHSLGERLFSSYLLQPYEFFLDRNTTELAKNIYAEVRRVISGVLIPGLQLAARLVMVIFIIGMLLSVDVRLALTVSGVLGATYSIVYVFLRDKIKIMGTTTTETIRVRNRLLHEALMGVKEIKLYGKEAAIGERFSTPSITLARSEAASQLITGLPRFALETIAFSGVVLIILYLISTKNGNIGQILPLLALYVFAGYRLLPALQQIFHSLSVIRYNMPALEILYSDLCSEDSWHKSARTGGHAPESLGLTRRILLDNISYNYPNSDKKVIDNLTIEILDKQTIGLVGETGSGKSTLIDILLGLLEPVSGRLLVDDNVIDAGNVRNWQMSLGYVPQQIYLTDDTLARNIALGVGDDEIDRKTIEACSKMARLHDFIETLADGYETVIGERGVKLSGGQRQRVGIARALYRNPDVLVMDEATSALDNVTEKRVMQAIDNLAHKKTLILIAHRLATVRGCDVIFVLENGKVICKGKYDELMVTCPRFRMMAQVSLQGNDKEADFE
jgi:ABC-type multidrug transport system fused ATPase/permease subunit